MDLYTSLTRLKQAMNGGELPPMTPLTEAAKEIIDPALTISGDGAGGIVADAERGLQCPVRGCGSWHHDLGRHVAMKHRAIGVDAFREAMSIPQTAPLMSEWFREQKRDIMRGRNGHLRRYNKQKASPNEVRKRAASIRRTAASMGSRNLRDRCVAQLSHKLIDLANTLGRSPTVTEARELIGHTLVGHIINTFGSWNAAKTQCGLSTLPAKGQRDGWREAALTALDAWLREHGDLPTQTEAHLSNATPMLPPSWVFRAAFAASDWDECMRRAAAHMDIHGGRYGLPVNLRGYAVLKPTAEGAA